MAQNAYQYCTGAVLCYYAPLPGYLFQWSAPSPGSALFLGTCEQYPLVMGAKNWRPTYNDLFGDVPFDRQKFPDTKVIVLDLDKFNSTNVEALLNEGAADPEQVGAFKTQGGNGFCLWLVFSNYGKAQAIPDMPPGEFYWSCSVSESNYDPIGTRNRKTRIVIEADPAYIANTIEGVEFGGNITYSTSPNLFAGLPTGL